ncbi:hypothetical protein [Halalkalibacter okhensis]|uniref:Uncharacterized protein n=1 Tax=Halalkalibacter okhensis TaxID=333138 RepID=A0A0B0IJZ7_9BACI|nr:hypothetical protein [Halalkalibacter okhensis]KHF39996.1 hypothetical protein LQ50_11950 [Halalkalibacter okhensis]
MAKKKKNKRKAEMVDILNLVKQTGIKSEEKLNGWLKELLSEEAMMELVKLGTKNHKRIMRDIREYMNIITHYLNVPTKDDVANVAKLARQIEEKIDLLEEKMSIYPVQKKKTEYKKKHTKEQLRQTLINNILNATSTKK